MLEFISVLLFLLFVGVVGFAWNIFLWFYLPKCEFTQKEKDVFYLVQSILGTLGIAVCMIYGGLR